MVRPVLQGPQETLEIQGPPDLLDLLDRMVLLVKVVSLASLGPLVCRVLKGSRVV